MTMHGKEATEELMKCSNCTYTNSYQTEPFTCWGCSNGWSSNKEVIPPVVEKETPADLPWTKNNFTIYWKVVYGISHKYPCQRCWARCGHHGLNAQCQMKDSKGNRQTFYSDHAKDWFAQKNT